MAARTRRQFRPELGPDRLEDRIALSVAAVAVSAGVKAAAVDPLVQPATLKVETSYLSTTVNEIHAAYKGFLNKYTAAVQRSIDALGSGQNEANLVKSLK